MKQLKHLKYLKYLLPLLALLLVGCSEDKIVYVQVDANGTIIKQINSHKPKYKTINPEIVCDTFGNAYYYNRAGQMNGYSNLAPVMYNGPYGAYIKRCKDL